ncbi:Beta-barrel assembly machine subunit BamF [Vannielia litorea]|uniref:Beta-barrel assembly machine subunit BamF n=2 Tax=Vannielia litorea TaxID=1217970 RepID=A0A1N6HAD7_9RHOB|nr:Beta-barrel assembly machine subunit BamF [Vannielia litorea]
MMAKQARRMALLLLVCASVAACSREPDLMNIERGQDTPDEFAILPNKPIQQPENYRDLPAPTLGGSNRADASPFKDAVAALGGNPERLNTTGQLVGEPGLIGHVTRFGLTRNIRQQLAAEDYQFRKKNDGRLLERLFNVNVYYKAYARQSLDQESELSRFRRAGVATPSAPPAGGLQ